MQIINSALAFYIRPLLLLLPLSLSLCFCIEGSSRFFFVMLCWCSWDSSVTTVHKLHDGRPRNHSLISSTGRRHLSFPKHPGEIWCPFSLPFDRHRWLFHRNTVAEVRLSTLPSSSAKFKNEWSYTATSSYAFMACIATILALPLVFAVLHTRRHTFPIQLCYSLCTATLLQAFFSINRGYPNLFPP
jgi:hypothetical protein